jgi:hypothetical protein
LRLLLLAWLLLKALVLVCTSLPSSNVTASLAVTVQNFNSIVPLLLHHSCCIPGSLLALLPVPADTQGVGLRCIILALEDLDDLIVCHCISWLLLVTVQEFNDNVRLLLHALCCMLLSLLALLLPTPALSYGLRLGC